MTEYFFLLEDDGVTPACERVVTIAPLNQRLMCTLCQAEKKKRHNEPAGYPLDPRPKQRNSLAF